MLRALKSIKGFKRRNDKMGWEGKMGFAGRSDTAAERSGSRTP